MLGIIELDSSYPKAEGNMANPSTFDFPVRYATARIKPGWWLDVGGPDDNTLQAFLAAGRELQDQGVAAITTTCGLFAIFQEEATAELDVPVFTSPLMLIPMVAAMIGPRRRVGVVTAAGERIFEHGFLARSGVSDTTRIAVAAVDACPEFLDVIRTQQKPALDSRAFEDQLLGEVNSMLREHPDIGALVLECSDIPPYARRLAKETGLPVFDFTAMAAMVHRACLPPAFRPHLPEEQHDH
ncbi:aspartate/glutamate racemase family protein [Pseudarthrobacter raffinosi]|uniref:aspartate/glutamate racemase family protein n=1 Tax=Pseudarthrobacter raffinosi TaxID=2953651 RepID=UPI00208F4128|nr:aspartate/glutamate racemase family protein [Pseudarthrobacter sp. MDT3-9]MCO4252079.1 aspartate/glutamate racemase family protein [Pseudarthrobacter sp. MDT3-9]